MNTIARGAPRQKRSKRFQINSRCVMRGSFDLQECASTLGKHIMGDNNEVDLDKYAEKLRSGTEETIALLKRLYATIAQLKDEIRNLSAE